MEVETAVVVKFDNILRANSSLTIKQLYDATWLGKPKIIVFAQDIGDKVTKLPFLGL